MTTAVDTNVLIDVLGGDPTFSEWSEGALLDALENGPLIVCEVVYAELAAKADNQALVDGFLDRTGITLVVSGQRALFRAGKAWDQFASAFARPVTCPTCGASQNLTCERCGRHLTFRQHIIPDFLVGAHALTHARALITRDRRYFQTYFPGLELITPLQ